MNRISLEAIQNTLIDFYLDGFRRREKNKEKLPILLINSITIFSYIVFLAKTVVGFNKFSNTTKLILFDVPYLLGGIEIYNRILFLLGITLGLVVHLTLHWTTSERHREWTQIFELARGKSSQQFVIEKSQIEIQPKLMKAMKVVYKMMMALWIVLSKIILYKDLIMAKPKKPSR